jgi:hypothetical protein
MHVREHLSAASLQRVSFVKEEKFHAGTRNVDAMLSLSSCTGQRDHGSSTAAIYYIPVHPPPYHVLRQIVRRATRRWRLG